MAFEVANRSIIHEILDREVIIANLDNGAYYSLRETSVPIWQLVLSGHDRVSIGVIFSKRYAIDVSREIDAFLNELIQENLLKESPSIVASQTPNELFWPSVYRSPGLEKYEEMKSLLMLDPVHEVDEQGWPSRS